MLIFAVVYSAVILVASPLLDEGLIFVLIGIGGVILFVWVTVKVQNVVQKPNQVEETNNNQSVVRKCPVCGAEVGENTLY